MSLFIEQTLNGVQLALLLFLVAAGLTLVFGIMDFMNLSHGSLFMMGAALTSIWVPHAFLYSLLGLLGGFALGIIGLWLSRWERAPQSLHYTPNRWLVLAVTLVVFVYCADITGYGSKPIGVGG